MHRKNTAPTRLFTGSAAALALVATSAVGLVAAAAPADAAVGGRVVRWVDGDTVETTRGTVRLIGIDTPEVGRCGFKASSAHARSLAPAGSQIVLRNPSSLVNQDKYDRKLRYVETLAGRDIGKAQIRDGAKARYDSGDGYQWHPREATYHRVDRRNADYACEGTGGSAGSVAPLAGGECPASAPIKGNADSMIYHQPWQQYYDVTVAEECFATTAAAEAAGYRAAQV